MSQFLVQKLLQFIGDNFLTFYSNPVHLHIVLKLRTSSIDCLLIRSPFGQRFVR